MQKLIKILFTVILSVLIVSPVHAEEAGNVEFEFSTKKTENNVDLPNHDIFLANLIVSGLEPNKSYQWNRHDDSEEGQPLDMSITTDENGSATIPLYTITGKYPTTVTIKGVDKLIYSIEYPKYIETEYRHQSSIEVYHNNNLVGTVVSKRNQGIKTNTYTVSSGSKEKIILGDRLYSAFRTIMYAGIDGPEDPGQKFQYTAHITGLDPEDTVLFSPVGGTELKYIEVHAVNNEIVYDFEADGASTLGMTIYAIPDYAKITITQHANSSGYIPNCAIAVGNDAVESGNTVPGIELSTPQLSGGSRDTNQVEFLNKKIQTVMVSKSVEGNQGNRHKQFDFNAKLTDNNDIDYTGPVSIAKQDGTVEQVTPDENHIYKFKLQHGDTVKLFGFDKVIKNVTITEEDNDYQTKVAHDSEQPVDGKSVTVDIENTNASIRYTNSKSLIVPTGISLPVGGALFIIVGIGIIFISKKHKQVV